MLPPYNEHISHLNPQQCLWIKSLCTEYRQSEIVNRFGYEGVKPDFRSSKTCYVNLDSTTQQKLISMIDVIGVTSLPQKEIHLLEYGQGGFFSSHRDGNKRYKTVIIQLTNPQEYEGGELYVEDNMVSKEQGTIVMFSSNHLHELKLVKSGVRHALVLWLKKEHFNEEKELI